MSEKNHSVHTEWTKQHKETEAAEPEQLPTYKQAPCEEAEATAAKGSMKPFVIVGLLMALVIALALLLPPVEQATLNPTASLQTSPTPTPTATPKPTSIPMLTAEERYGGVEILTGTWEGGQITIVALSEKKLLLELTDSRGASRQYNGYGHPWNISMNFGLKEIFAFDGGGSSTHYPFEVRVRSHASKQMFVDAYNAGVMKDFYIGQDDFYSVDFRHYTFRPDLEEGVTYYHLIDGSYEEQLDIERKEAVYTATITLPEWFNVSAYTNLSEVYVDLLGTKYYELYYSLDNDNVEWWEASDTHYFRPR